MSRAKTPTIHCDSEDDCTAWDVDWWQADVSAVGGVRITATTRAPGWTVTAAADDLCPKHSPAPSTQEPTAPGRTCPTREPEPHLLGEFPMTCYRCHLEADS